MRQLPSYLDQNSVKSPTLNVAQRHRVKGFCTASMREVCQGLSLLCLVLLLSAGARAATFTVTNTNDSGAGSLRQAMTDAGGTAGIDTIAFNIPGGGVKKIAPLTPLPDIFARPVIIDGTTQPGWSIGNLLIEISGENLSDATTAIGFKFSGMQSASPRSFVHGLIINRFGGSGIFAESSNNITIEGCFIGTDATGTIDYGNSRGVDLYYASDITVGGNTAATRNVISGNSGGIFTFAGDTINVIGNYIGTDKTGMTAVGNGTAMQFQSSFCTIGGATAAERNVISGNTSSRAVIISNASNTLQNNYIGVAADGTTPLGNAGIGVDVINSLNLINAGSHVISGNVIANNNAQGITFFPSYHDPVGNKITANSIYNNGSITDIDLDRNGISSNDAGDADTGSNNLQNFPVLTSAVVGATTINIQGTFNSEASTSYRLEFFLNSTSQREGKTFLGSQDVTTNAGGNATFNATVSGNAFSGQYVTATATRNVTPLDTSEFSDPIPVSVETFVVTNANDSGAGSLRQAIADANASANPNLITFAITPLNGSVKTITLTSALPTIGNQVTIDGLTQDGATCATPKIELNGSNVGAGGDGFFVTADNVLLQGFVINRFPGDGIVLDSNNTNTIRCNKIGTRSSGSTAAANDANGILLDTSHSNLIENNTISANGASGIRGLFAQNNTIQGNIIGLSSSGANVLPNVSGGIGLFGGLGNVIGGTTSEKRNVVSGNSLVGIILSSSASNSVKGNYIGVDINGVGTTFGNTGSGIAVATSSADDNVIGGTETGAANVIAFNTAEGITFISTAGTGNRILS